MPTFALDGWGKELQVSNRQIRQIYYDAKEKEHIRKFVERLCVWLKRDYVWERMKMNMSFPNPQQICRNPMEGFLTCD